VLIPITNHGKIDFTSIDDEDAYKVIWFNWCVNGGGYVYRKIGGQCSFMHKVICNSKEEVDHINLNKLDNRKHNLRACNRNQNQCNKKPRTKSGYIGVFTHCNGKYFTAEVMSNGIRYYVGIFKNVIEAAIARDKKAKEVQGQFAKLNFPENNYE
jgi:hypothetical protein